MMLFTHHFQLMLQDNKLDTFTIESKIMLIYRNIRKPVMKNQRYYEQISSYLGEAVLSYFQNSNHFIDG